jgi:hypothetical protein
MLSAQDIRRGQAAADLEGTRSSVLLGPEVVRLLHPRRPEQHL